MRPKETIYSFHGTPVDHHQPPTTTVFIKAATLAPTAGHGVVGWCGEQHDSYKRVWERGNKGEKPQKNFH